MNWGILGNVIFKNWSTADLSSMAKSFDSIDNGLDFGFTNPNALVRVHVSEKSKTVYIFDTMGKRGQTYTSLVADLKQKVGSQVVTCDNEDSRGVYMLQQGGIRAVPAKKGADSVINGIIWLQGYKLVIDVKQQEFINEIQQYHWQTDKDGNVLEKPVKKNDHFMDALRYAVEWRILQGQAQSTGRL